MAQLNKIAVLAGAGALLFSLSGCSSRNDERYAASKPAPKSSYEADNTGRNANDANRPTPTDQGTSEADVTVTQQIRQAMMNEETLSVTAKNAKVITRDGKVTLRGPVVDASEREKMVAIAERIAGAGNVTNQLELESPKG